MRNINYNKSKGQELRILCPECKIETRHIVLQSVEIDGSKEFDEYFSIDWGERYQLVECQGCQTITYREESSNSEDYDPRTGISEIHERLYPLRTKDTLFIKEFLNTSSNLKRIYREVIDSYNNEIFTLCAAGLRAIIEGICAEEGIKDGPVEVAGKGGVKKIVRKKNLEGKIAGLCEKGILTKKQSEILHEHRYMGNEAVHELTMPSKKELELAIHIVEHTLESVFEIPLKASALNKTRTKKKNP